MHSEIKRRVTELRSLCINGDTLTSGIADYDSKNATNRPRSTYEKMKTEK